MTYMKEKSLLLFFYIVVFYFMSVGEKKNPSLGQTSESYRYPLPTFIPRRSVHVCV